MSIWILITGGAVVVLLAVIFFITRFTPRSNRLGKLSKAVGLPLPAEIEPAVEEAARVDWVAAFIASVTSTAVATVILMATRATSALQIAWGYALCLCVGAAIGASIVVLVNERRRQEKVVRFARSSAVSLDDYLSKLDQWAPAIAVTLLIAGVALHGFIAPGGFAEVSAFSFFFVAGSVATLVISEFAKRRILRRGQPAGSPLELAWDDALKSRALIAIGGTALTLGAYGGLAATAFGAGATGSDSGAVSWQMFVACIAAFFALAVSLVSTSRQSQKRYLRRLWPERAADLDVAARAAYPTATSGRS